MPETIKLTLRMPAWLHQQLQRYAQAENQSLNKVILETIKTGLNQKITYPEREDERVERVLRESGLLEPLGPQWFKDLEDVPDLTHEELWELTKGISPLSETIIEDREPR